MGASARKAVVAKSGNSSSNHSGLQIQAPRAVLASGREPKVKITKTLTGTRNGSFGLFYARF